MICGCPNCKPYQKYIPNEITPEEVKEFYRKLNPDPNRYIEAINGARRMRSFAYGMEELVHPPFPGFEREEDIAWFRWWFTLSHDPRGQAAYQR